MVDVLADPARATPALPVPANLLMPEITIDPGRGTAVGRSVSGPVVGQQTTQPVDDRALRGTMFGHGVHLPGSRRGPARDAGGDLEGARRGRARRSDHQRDSRLPAWHLSAGGSSPRAQEPFPRSSQSHAEDTPIELRTVLPRNTLIIRVAATGAGIAAIVVAALLWVRSTDDAELNARSPVMIPVARPPKPIEAQPMVGAPTPSPPPAPCPLLRSLLRSRRRRHRPRPDVAAAAEAPPTRPSSAG